MTRSSGKKTKAKKPAVKSKTTVKRQAKTLAKVRAAVRKKVAPLLTSPAEVTSPATTTNRQVPEVQAFEKMTFEQQAKQILNTFAPADMGLVVGKAPAVTPFDAQLPALSKTKG